MTDNHRYNTPTEGTQNWDVPLNENFERMDVDVEVRAPETDRDQYEPKDGAKFFATDTGATFVGNGSEWMRVDSTGQAPRVRTLKSADINCDQYVLNHSGTTLSERLKSALSALPGGQGTVYVTAREDGQSWTWGEDLVVDPTDYRGVEIVVGHSVRIEYNGTGVPLTFDSHGQHQGDRHQVRLIGGEWVATGDATGWLRLRDIILAEIHPHQVHFAQSSKADCFGISVENHDLYSEANRLCGDIRAPVGIQFVPSSETGGSGTDSFHDTVIDHAHINADNVGIRLAGVFQMCELRKVALFGTSSGADLMVLDAPRMDGTVITATKWESPPNPGDVTAVVTGPNYDGWYGPTVIGGYLGYGVTENHRDDGAKKPTVMRVVASEQGLAVEDLHTGASTHFDTRGNLSVDGTVVAGDVAFEDSYNASIEKRDEGPLNLINQDTAVAKLYSDRLELGAPTRYEPVDVTALGSADRGTVAYHDGSSGPEGPAFYDGGSWVSLVDGSSL